MNNDMRSRLVPHWDEASDEERHRYEVMEIFVSEAMCQADNYVTLTNRIHGQTGDQYAGQRQRDSEVLDEIDAQIRAINKLRKFIKNYPTYARHAWGYAHTIEEIAIRANSGGQRETTLDQLLEAYSTGLKQNQAKKGPYEHRTRCGPIDFGTTIDDRSGPTINEAEIGLILLLVIYFKRFTSGVDAELLGYINPPESIPDEGQPHWEICADIFNSVFDKESPSTGENLRIRIRKLVQKYPQMGFVGWPDIQCHKP